MIKGLGTDIAEIERIESSLARLGEKFAKRILTSAEMLEYREQAMPARFLAKRFCAKEACVKALGTGIGRGTSWQHMSVGHDEFGKPLMLLTEGAADRMRHLGAVAVHLSLSDEKRYVVATVIIE